MGRTLDRVALHSQPLRVRSCFALIAGIALSSCTWGQGMGLSAYRSASLGHTSRGGLHRPARLPHEGQGYRIPEEWRERGNVFGTSQLVAAVQRVGAQVSKRLPGRTLGVADLSPHEGGWTPWHRSHQSGRDVDLLFLSVSSQGQPLAPPSQEMIHYNREGRAFAPRGKVYREAGWRGRRFDDAGNWAVVQALLTDAEIRVQWIFVSQALRARLLKQARRERAPEWVVEYAKLVLAQPGGVSAHDDHFHIRIYCPREDLDAGCRDTGRVWPHEAAGHGRHLGGERYRPIAIRAMSAHLAWMPRV